MKIYFHDINKNNITSYVYGLLKYLAQRNGHELASLDDCDLAAISLSHYSYLPELIRLRKMTKKKIIVGGHISHSPYALLAFADYVNLGHGFEFFEKVRSIANLEDFDFIISKRKLDGRFSQYINWDIIPVIKIAKNLYSFLWSVGCKNKCKFCLTSWMNLYQVNPHKNALVKIMMQLRSSQINIISNDYSDSHISRASANITLNQLIENPYQFQDIGLIRFGIESPSADTRRFLGKNIDDEMIRKAINILKILRKRCNIFMIAGFNTQEQFEDFRYIIGEDIATRPKLGFIFNYIQPNIGTPLERFDMTKLIEINIPKIKLKWKQHNGRIIIFRDERIFPYHPMIMTAMERSDWETIYQVLEIYKLRKWRNLVELIELFEKTGLLHLLNGQFVMPGNIVFPYNKKSYNRRSDQELKSLGRSDHL